MSELIGAKRVFTLLEVSKSIQKTLAARYPGEYWVKAEISKLHYYPHSGHCYPQLVEKSGDKILAQIRGNLWSHDFQRINKQFMTVLGEPLRDGIKILFSASISFHPEHGLALRITDVDPTFTLGDLEFERQEAIRRLQTDGIYDNNKLLILPQLPKRIAIISVATSNGYADFMKVLKENPWNYNVSTMLFPALLQGEKAIGSIINQLRNIRRVRSHFDLVAIIRGGGGEVGLSCYNNFELAREVALFPVPVITGIGHSTNETVVELVAHQNAITPTKLAEFLLQLFHNFSIPVDRAGELIVKSSLQLMKDARKDLQSGMRRFQTSSAILLSNSRNNVKSMQLSLQKELDFFIRSGQSKIHQVQTKLRFATPPVFKNAHVEISHNEKIIANLDPRNILKRGYSLTLSNGRLITSISELVEGDQIETRVSDGSIFSEVKSLQKFISK